MFIFYGSFELGNFVKTEGAAVNLKFFVVVKNIYCFTHTRDDLISKLQSLTIKNQFHFFDRSLVS